MSMTQFLQQNETRIENIDGNLDDAAITIMGSDGRLEFYYFENGILVGSKVKAYKWWVWVWDQWPDQDQDHGDPRPVTQDPRPETQDLRPW